MAELTRTDIVTKLNEMSDLDKGETLSTMVEWLNVVGVKEPQKIIDDLESYTEYASKS